MFLSWSFFYLNLFYLALDVLVATAFAAALSHIARTNGNYAQSIRWIKQAGPFEMVKTLWTSFGKVTGRHWLGLLATFVGGYALVGVLVGVKSGANTATSERNPSLEVRVSKQFIAENEVTTVPVWSNPVSYDTSMEDALARALNNTKVNPRASPKKRYRPRLSAYEPACDRLDAQVFDDGAIVLTNDGCAMLTLMPSTDATANKEMSYIVQGHSGQAKVIVPTRADKSLLSNNTVSDVSLLSRLTYRDQDCATADISMHTIDSTRIGLIVSPTTVLTTCPLSSGELVSLSLTNIRFVAQNQKQFQSVASSIFEHNDELIAGMQDSVNNGTLTNLPAADPLAQIIVMEVNVTGTEVRALICNGSRLSPTAPAHISCAYTITSVLITKSRPVNTDILKILPGKDLHLADNKVRASMSFYHLPMVSADEILFAIPKILNASTAAAAYFAYLGPNFVLDWERSTLYVAYDTVDIIKGYEVSSWLFWTMVGVMVGCLVFWGATEYWVEPKYKRSLYYVVSQKLTDGEANSKPRLHQFDTNTHQFDGRRIVPVRTAKSSGEEKGAILSLVFEFLTDV